MANLNTTNNFLESLIGAGADAQKNLYEVTFNGGLLTDYSENLSVRCSGFTPPEYEQSTYPVYYITAKIDRPTAKVVRDRKFTLTFRVDANLEMYNALLKQQAITFNAAKHYAANDLQALSEAGLLFDTHVNYIADGLNYEGGIPVEELFHFKDCWISNIDTISFDSKNSSPAEVSVTINYLRDYNNIGANSLMV